MHKLRPTKNNYMLNLATQVATRATCQEAQVGCVITNSDYQILSTGYNGSLPGQPECQGKLNCKITRYSESAGTSQFCPTIHAEVNAIHQYQSLHKQHKLPPGAKVFCTLGPCYSCLQQLYLVGCREIHFIHSNSWVKCYQNGPKFEGLKLIQHDLPIPSPSSIALDYFGYQDFLNSQKNSPATE